VADIRVLVVDDHAILREGIRSLLERQEGISVIGEAGNGKEGLDRVAELQPDIVLMDIAMPEMNGLEATRLIKEKFPDVKVLILTQHDNREYIEPLLQAGASGYVLKRSGGREVVTAIREVHAQGAFLEPGVARELLASYQQGASNHEASLPHLTVREREVIRWVVKGKTNKEIANILSISPKTVSVHRSNVMIKLKVQNSIELLNVVSKYHLI
jgi:DNA-binding NarL/FixJ family response regulator